MRVTARASISPSSRRRSLARQFRVEERVERVDRQMEALEDEIGRLVERGRRAVAENEVGLAKAADRVAQPVARRDEEVEALVGFGHATSQRRARPEPDEVFSVDFGRETAPEMTLSVSI